MPLPGLSWGEAAEDVALARTAAVVERFDEGEGLGAGGGPVRSCPGPDLFSE